jgi:hypothetical protein
MELTIEDYTNDRLLVRGEREKYTKPLRRLVEANWVSRGKLKDHPGWLVPMANHEKLVRVVDRVNSGEDIEHVENTINLTNPSYLNIDSEPIEKPAPKAVKAVKTKKTKKTMEAVKIPPPEKASPESFRKDKSSAKPKPELFEKRETVVKLKSVNEESEIKPPITILKKDISVDGLSSHEIDLRASPIQMAHLGKSPSGNDSEEFVVNTSKRRIIFSPKPSGAELDSKMRKALYNAHTEAIAHYSRYKKI